MRRKRPYSLWTVLILLSCASLLHAMRRQTRSAWSLYALTMAAGLYTHALFALIVLAHALYAIGFRRSLQPSRETISAYAWSTLAATIAYLPWACIIVSRSDSIIANSGWLFLWDGVPALLRRWLVAFSAPYFDLDRGATDPLTFVVGVALVALCLYALYDLRRTAAPHVRVFVALLIVIPALALMVPDLALGGRLISSARFLIPAYLGFGLAVSRLVSERAFSDESSGWRALWKATLAALVACGIVSAAASATAQTWWNKSFSGANVNAARIVNLAAQPLLVSDSFGTNPRNVISLGYQLDSKVRFRLFDARRTLQIPELTGSVFVFNPSARLRSALEMRGYRIEELDRRSGLSRLVQ